MFRLPLRTEQNAIKSRIKQPSVTADEVERLLKDFESVMGDCLLFLSSVKKVSVYTAKPDGEIELEYETCLSADDSNTRTLHEFIQHVQHEARKLKTDNSGLSLGDLTPREVTVQCCLSDSADRKTEWLVVHRFGLSHTNDLPEPMNKQSYVREHRLLPVGGVAVCLTPEQHRSKVNELRGMSISQGRRPGQAFEGAFGGTTKPFGQNDQSELMQAHKVCGSVAQEAKAKEEKASRRVFHAYCTLPLPVNTGLPVHVNARFALDHETRRNINTHPCDDLVVWNRLLADRVIVPAYIKGLRQVRQQCFALEEISISQNNTEGDSINHHFRNDQRSLRTNTDIGRKLEQYNDLFPCHTNRVDAFWKNLIGSLYRELAQPEADVFPVKRTDLDRVLWVPASKTFRFHGYFWGLDDHLELKEILSRLNMNIIHCPFRIYKAFQDSQVGDVVKVQADTVVTFLRSCRTPGPETCNLKHLPKDVTDTSFGTADNAIQVFSFICQTVPDLRDLPLDLRESGMLHRFTQGDPTLFSDFCDLLPGSSELFLDKALKDLLPSPLAECDFLKSLDIPTFAELLQYSLDKSAYGSGQTVLLQTSAENRLPNEDWIKRLWNFLNEDTESTLANMTTCLSDWNLIPVSRGTEVHLFPFKDRHHVVYISVSGGTFFQDSDKPIYASLSKLPLNNLNTSLCGVSVASHAVASTKNPEGLLTALIHSDLHDHHLNAGEAEHILDFFYRSFFTATADSVGEKQSDRVLSDIRSLPFFERLDGSVAAVSDSSSRLCLPSQIPISGLTDWSKARKIVLLKENRRLEELFRQLGISSPGYADFYACYLLPSIADLPSEAIQHHMEFIRDSLSLADRQRVQVELKYTQFIEGPDGIFCMASDFYCPDNLVFEAMMTPDRFPPPPYDSEEWKSFLKELGLVCDVSEDLFLRFANQVQEAGKHAVSESVAKQSQELSKCLKESVTLREERFLKKVKNVKFLLPLCHNDMLHRIHAAFKPPTPLVSFSEAYPQSKRFVVWTSACLLSSDAYPSHSKHWKPCMDDWIGFRQEPPSDIVIEHVCNICQALNTNRRADKSLLSEFADRELSVVEQVMREIYQHLTNVCDQELKELRDIAVIFDRQRKAMFLPRQVVITILPDQVMEGHVLGAPEKLGKFFDLFRRLGVRGEVTLDHYARALEEIHRVSAGNILNPNHLQLVSKAVDVLFKLLNCSKERWNVTLPTLFLPSEDISMLQVMHPNLSQVRLADSRQLIQEVSCSQQHRIKSPLGGLAVFVGFVRLGLKDYSLKCEAKLLPEIYRMKRWNEVVTETLVESCTALAFEDRDTQLATDQIHSEECARAVKRLANHKSSEEGHPLTKEHDERIDEQLKGVKLLKVRSLQTVLSFNGAELTESEEKKNYFIVRPPGNPCQQATGLVLYIDEDVPFDFRNRQFLRAVHKVISWAVDMEFGVLLCHCLEDLCNAQHELDMEEITVYHISDITTVFPPPGSYVPDYVYELDLLDRGIYEFKLNEYAAYELYHPALEESEDTDSDSAHEDGEGARRNKKPKYILARVKEVIAPDDDDGDVDVNTRLMRIRYAIDIGEEAFKQVMNSNEFV